jgi:hypothetical protein
MPKSKVTEHTSDPPVAEPVAFTVPEFCRAHRISVSTYYNLKSQGRGPRELDAGRTIISREDAVAWRTGRKTETTE